jgi:hypothetical protein
VEDSSVEEDRYKLPLFDGMNYGDWRFRMEIFLDEKRILTHISRSLVELQEEFRLSQQNDLQKMPKLLTIEVNAELQSLAE